MRINNLGRLTLAIVALLAGAIAIGAAGDEPQTAQSPTTKSAKPEDIRVQLAKQLPGAHPEDIRPTPIAGLYEVALGNSSAFITADGKYSIYNGDLYEMSTKTNLTEARRNEFRSRAVASIKESDTIVFGPSSPAKHTITVFIDVDCGYCRKLHSEIAELNKLGVRVRYAAYPRSGPGSSSWAKMETVWCSKDRRNALTRAQLDEDIGDAKCGATPIASQYKLGDEMGVNGTPAIFTEAGDYIGGYLPPQKLVAHLNELKSQPTGQTTGQSSTQPAKKSGS